MPDAILVRKLGVGRKGPVAGTEVGYCPRRVRCG